MITYEKIEDWWGERENKNKVVLALCFVVIFLVGFGTGRYEQKFSREQSKVQANYTIQTPKKPEVLGNQTVVEQGAASSTQASQCTVKGNISAAGKKIYHVKGGSFYSRTKEEQCFNTEAEAVAAGFVKSSR